MKTNYTIYQHKWRKVILLLLLFITCGLGVSTSLAIESSKPTNANISQVEAKSGAVKQEKDADTPKKKSSALENIIAAIIYICGTCWVVSTCKRTRQQEKLFATLLTPQSILQHYQNINAETNPCLSVDDPLVLNLEKELGEWYEMTYSKDFPAKIAFVPDNVAHFSRTVDAFNELIAARPSHPEILNLLANAAQLIHEAQTRAFSGSKTIYCIFSLFTLPVLTLSPAFFYQACQSGEYRAIIDSVWGNVIIIVPLILYYFTSLRPKFLIFLTAKENKGSSLSVGGRASESFFKTMATIPDTETVVWKNSAGTVVREEEDATSGIVKIVLLFMFHVMMGILLPLWTLINFIRNYYLTGMTRPKVD